MNNPSHADSFLQLLSSPSWAHLVFALLHSLWLGVVWLGLMTLGLKWVGRDPVRRYAVGLACLSGLVLSTFVAWAVLERSNPRPAGTQVRAQGPFAESTAIRAGEAASPTKSVAVAPAVPVGASAPTGQPWVAALALVWLSGSVLMFLRLGMDLLEVRRTRCACPASVAPRISRIVEEVGEALGLRRLPEVLEACRDAVPAVAGFLRPVVLLPVSLLTGASEAELRAVLAHELAHIRRHDYLVNIGQRLIESLLFFNPAVWWINRQIRQEREACCDALAAGLVGGPGVYVEALAVWAERLPLAGRRLGVAFPGDQKPSSLLDRVRRLLAPGYQPSLRLPFSSLLAFLMLSGVLLAAVWRTTNLAVLVAAEILTPQQRVARIAEIRAQTTLPDREYSEDDKIVIEGQVRTWDGAPLPPGVQVHVKSERPSSSYGFGSLPLRKGHFHHRLEFGKIRIAAGVQDGYGPAFIGPLETRPGGSISNIDIVLPKGFVASLRLVDPAGSPVQNVALHGTYQNPVGWIPVNRTTDADGMIHLTNCVATPMDWEADAPGFMFERRVLRFMDGATNVWSLRKGRPTTGQVVSRISGEPIQNAVLKAVYRGSSTGAAVQGQFEQAPVLARTDINGRFELTSLTEDADQVLLVEAPAFGRRLVGKMAAGKENIRIELGPELFVAGEVQGDLTLLDSRPEPVVWVNNPFAIPGHGEYSANYPVGVSVQDGVGRFVATNLLAGEVRLAAGASSVALVLSTRPITNATIRLGEPKATAKAGPEREVVFRFFSAEKGLNVSGVLKARTWSQSDGVTTNRSLAIVQGEARIQAKANGYVSYETRGLVGAWIPEEHALRVPPGDGPMVVDLKAIPAGAVLARVLNADGSDASGILVSVDEVTASPQRPTSGSLGEVGKNSAGSDDGPTRFVAQPLPLGGAYRLIAWRGNQFAASPVLRLTREKPIQEVEMRFVSGQRVRALVSDSNGKPLPGIEIVLLYSTPEGHGFSIQQEVTTDESGMAAWDGINPDMPGRYTVRIDKASGYQPASSPIEFGGSLTKVGLRSGMKLSGRVLRDSTGNALAGVELFALQTDPNPSAGISAIHADAPTDEDGNFKFTKLSDAEYSIFVPSGEIVSHPSGQVKARAGSVEPLVLRIKPRGGFKLTENGRPVSAD